MYTQCPQCLTYFQVTPEHLKIAQGNVRCGQCRYVFSALGNLTEEPPQVTPESDDSEFDEDIFIDEHELDEYYDEEVEDPYIIDDDADHEEIEIGDFAKSFSTPSSSSYENQPSSTEPQSSLEQAIAAMQALQNNSSKLTSLEEGRESYRAKLREIYDKSVKTKAKSSPKPAKLDSTQNSSAKLEPEQPDFAIEDINISPVEESEVKIEEAIHAIDELEFDEDFLDENIPIEQQNNESPMSNGEHFFESSEVAEDNLEQTIIEQETSTQTGIENSRSASVKNDDILQEIPQQDLDEIPQQPQVAFRNDLYIAEEDLVSTEDEDIIDLDEAEPLSNVDIKVKSLNRKPEKLAHNIEPAVDRSAISTPAAPADAAQQYTPAATATNRDEAMLMSEAPMSLPVIPSQLREDFEPLREEHQFQFSITVWGVGSILLMLLFLGQTVYFKHDDLAKVQQLRPHIEKFCKFLSCELSLPSDIHRLDLVSQDIRSHPKRKSALLVSVTIISNATYIQAYPRLQITFADLNGQKVAMRRFKPHEYLPANISTDAGMLPDTPIKIELEMMDPGSNAVNFEFDFFPAI